MSRYCDLHTHSVFSDGSFTPRELIDMAKQSELAALALCDHNSSDGLSDFLAAAKGSGIEVAPSVEFSVDYHGEELHLIGMFIDKEYFSCVNDKMEEMRRRKERSNIDLIASLAASGISLDYDYIKSKTPNGRVNRAHIAAELMRIGYTKSIEEGFATFLSPDFGHYKLSKHFSFFEMVDFIKSIKAVPVVAHPFQTLTQDTIRKFLAQAKEAGLVGMECAHSGYDENTIKTSLELALEYDLLPSGGSDFHGTNKPDIRIGVGRGNLKVPYEWYEALRAAKP